LDYIPAKKLAEEWGVTVRAIQYMCNDGRIKNAVFIAHSWLIPISTERPPDMRYKANKQIVPEQNDSPKL
jgi:hypothetical protein